MERYFAGEEFTTEEIQAALRQFVCTGEMVPVIMGSGVNCQVLNFLLHVIDRALAVSQVLLRFCEVLGVPYWVRSAIKLFSELLSRHVFWNLISVIVPFVPYENKFIAV